MNAKANAAYRLADHRALLESIIDTLNAVVLHADQEARAELRMRCSCIEESWGGVDEVSLRHIGVCLNCAFDVVAVNADSDAHEHVLRPFSDLAIETKEIRAFEGLEAEELVVEIALIDDGAHRRWRSRERRVYGGCANGGLRSRAHVSPRPEAYDSTAAAAVVGEVRKREVKSQ